MPLVVISDDFTGALDTGVQFAKYGLSVTISTTREIHGRNFKRESVDVLIVDAEMRHLSSQEAYRLTGELVEQAIGASVPYIYIKTDSGLRGNIGSELKAALDVSRESFLPFLPAFPDMNRTTQNGIHFIDQIPIHESVFGLDPFEPVRSPYVRDLFKGLDVSVAAIENAETYQTRFEKPTIGIFDVKTNDDFRRIAKHLMEQGQLKIVAGCAGFAAVLPEFIGLRKKDVPIPFIGRPLLVVCGSLNPITKTQIDYALENGFAHISLEPHQLFEKGYFGSAEGVRWLSAMEPLFHGEQPIIIDTGGASPERMETYLRQYQLSKEAARVAVSDALGQMMKQCMALGYSRERMLMIIGGDTLLGFIRQLEWQVISPICELEPGTVLSSIGLAERQLLVVSKSGGFGKKDLLERISEKIGAYPEGRWHDELHT